MFIANLIQMFVLAYTLLIFGRIIMSWMSATGNMDPYHPAAQFVYQATEPLLRPVREILPPMGGFDFSPIVVLFGMQFLGEILIQLFV